MKTFIIGLDCAAPDLLFNKFLPDLPNIQKIISSGTAGKLKSTIPPITVPAWMTMVTGKNAGDLGIYGFRHLVPHTYSGIRLATSTSVKEKRIWDYLAEKDLRSNIVSVPPSYPPYPVNGNLVGCFLTPDHTSDFTYPKSLKDTLNSIVPYVPDVKFRSDEKDAVLKGIFEMGEIRYKYIEHLLKNEPWDFFMFVDIGVDRIHHSFWSYFDETHHLYKPNTKYKNAIKDYYIFVDKWLGRLLKYVPDDTAIFVVSDHGAKKMKGGFCINEWLYDNNYLKLKKYPTELTRLGSVDIDWEKTAAWGWGGYYSRIFINRKGLFPNGFISDSEYKNIVKEIKTKLSTLTTPEGTTMDNVVFTPDEVYENVNGDSPDIMAFFDDLYYRAIGSMGHKKWFIPENDTGPDDAVHDWYGVIGTNLPQVDISTAKLEDIASTVLDINGFALNDKILRGNSLLIK